MAEEIKLTLSDVASEKITNRKLNSDNFQQWKRVVEIHVTERDKG